MYEVKIGIKTLIGMTLGFVKLDMKINDNIYSFFWESDDIYSIVCI